jgi:hypothetical protein
LVAACAKFAATSPDVTYAETAHLNFDETVFLFFYFGAFGASTSAITG